MDLFSLLGIRTLKFSTKMNKPSIVFTVSSRNALEKPYPAMMSPI